RAAHVITLEDPIEYLHTPQRSLIHQREVGAHVESFSSGLRAALRESPDVILVGEMRDLETISLALTAAAPGQLGLSTLHSGPVAGMIPLERSLVELVRTGRITRETALAAARSPEELQRWLKD